VKNETSSLDKLDHSFFASIGLWHKHGWNRLSFCFQHANIFAKTATYDHIAS